MPRKTFLLCLAVLCAAVVAVVLWQRSSTVPGSGGDATAGTTARSSELRRTYGDAAPAKAGTPYTRFASWSEKFLEASATERAGLIAEGVELARDRRVEMAELIRKDPKAALEAAVPMAVRQKLPQAIVDELEERVSGKGFYGVLIATDFEKGTSEIRRELIVGGRTFRAHVFGPMLGTPTKDKLIFHGVSLGNDLALVPEARPLEPGEIPNTAAINDRCPVSNKDPKSTGREALADVGGTIEKFCMASHIYLLNDRLAADVNLGGNSSSGTEPPTAEDAWSQGPKTLLYMRVAFPDDPSEPITEDGAYAAMDTVNQWFIENSYNTTELITTVTPLLMLPYPKAFYSEAGTGRLLSDSRQAAREQAALDTDNFHWDIVRHGNVPGFSYGGLAFVRGKGTWLQSSGVGVTAHELGHNYGLWHANYWTANGDSIIGPGTHQEYGNSFDTMGAASAGANHFNASFKNQLDWLPETFVHDVTDNGTYRIYTFDAPSIISGQKYAIKVRKDYDRNYWAEFRQRFPSNRWFGNGVHLNWDPWNNGVFDSAGGTHLLDATPGTPDGKNDCPVIVGRTFSDVAAGVHITPIARSNTGENWIDVVVNVGAFSNNAPPIASLIADRTAVAAAANVNFNVAASDADGDELAFAWDFGDGNFGPNAASVSKNWSAAGEYTVRCTVSDMKGGVYSQKITITVGSPATIRISGRVLSSEGAPLEGVRVHNGASGTSYRGTYTDSDGYYVLANNAAGSHTISAVKYGYTLDRVGWANPVTLGSHATGRDFVATAMPVVSIVPIDPQANEGSAGTGQFLISRTGPTNVALVVKMNRSGTATTGTDYSLSPNPAGSPLQHPIPVGAASVAITVTPVNDASSEGPEFVMLTLQQDTTYVLGSLAEAAVTILDDEAPTIPSVDVSASSPGLQSDNLATESGSDSGVFTFTRNGNVSGELAVSYSVTGTATAGVDYEALSGVITIPAGETLATLPFRIIDDIDVESNETVVVTILASPAYNGAGDNTSITIVDDDLTTVFVTASDDTARESNVSGGTFVISRVGRLDVNLAVNYTLQGTATAGSDYPALSGSIVIPAGRATMNIAVAALNDALSEGEETVVLELSSSESYNVGNPGSATITIIDDEAANVALAASDATATEGADNGTFTFTRTGGDIASPLEVHFAINGTAIRGADYADIPDSITIPAGLSTFALTITPIDDAINEGSERVMLTLLPSPDYSRTTETPVSVTITSNDSGLPGIGFVTAASSGLESDTTVELNVMLSSAVASSVTVNYAVTGGGATGGGIDYTLAAGTLTIPTNEINRSIVVTVVNDTVLETNETIRVTLSTPGGAQLDANVTYTYTILDDDRFGNVTVSALDATGSEAGDPAVFRISRTSGATSNLTVGFQILGSASSPTDYQPLPNSVTIPIGALFADLTVTPVDDSTDETNETVTINLLSAPGGRISSPDLASVTILDDDDSTTLPTVSVAATDGVAAEPGTDTGTFTFTRSGDTTSELAVTFTVGGTALAGDYAAIGTTVTFAAGASETNITITPVDDTTFETNETVTLTLTLLPAYRVGTSGSGTVVIEDNEVGVSIVAEGVSSEDGSASGSFLITRTGNTASDLTVNFGVAGTATRSVDYTSFSNSVVIPAGTSAVSIPVSAINDAIAEGSETVVTTITAGIGYTVRPPSSATLLILDDEPVVTISAIDNTAHEAGGDGLFTIARSGNIADPLTVNFTIGGSASNGVDYVTLPSQIVLEGGQTSSNLTVIAIDDLDVEGAEVVSIALDTNSTYSLGSPSSAVVTIVDDEVNLPPTVEILSPTSDIVFLPSTNAALVLEAQISDDGRPNPPGMTTSLWSRVSGPVGSTVTIVDAASTNSHVRFSANGVYVLRLRANDGQLETTRDLTVLVNALTSLGTGLQAYWRLDEISGSVAVDSSANNRNAAVTGATWSAGRFRNALDFDGVDDTASFSSPALTRLTLSAWVQSDTAGESTTPRVIEMPGFNVRIRRDPGTTANAVAIESIRSTTSGEWRTPGEVVSDGPWYHIVVSYDSSSTANQPTFWVNGVLQPPTTRTTPVGTQVANTGTGYIGNSAAGARTWDGRIDEMRLYDRLLTSNEVALLTSGPPTNTAPLVNAGPDRAVSGRGAALLSGSVTDADTPVGGGGTALSNLWVQISGPSRASFANPRSPATTVTFDLPGIYVLRLHASDGAVKVFDEMVVTVFEAPVVTIATGATPAAEFGPVPGTFTISRDRSTNIALSVVFTRSGTASNGIDYSNITSPATIPVGAFSTTLTVNPILDSLAEGDETVVLTISSNASYILGTNTAAEVVINDRPYDAWRFNSFTPPQLGDPLVSGDQADPDADRLKNLLEYALNLNPHASNGLTRFSGTLEEITPGARAFVVSYTRRLAPRDISYTIEVSSDLTNWSSGAAVAQEIGAEDDGNGVTETVRVRIVSDVAVPGQRFSRLRVVKQ
jgi:hypothetical protein